MGEEEASSSPLLRNRYWILRHGKSIPNQRALVVSSMENGILPEYGLAFDGVQQAKLAGELLEKELRTNNLLVENVRIYYSPFSRTTHTAKVVADVLGIPFEGCQPMDEIRERYFGPTFELQSHEKYSEIWALDEKDPFMPPEGGESVANVASRLAAALSAIEEKFQRCAVLIVSHGDPLQILQTLVAAAKESDTKLDLLAKIQAAAVPSVLSQHRKFALETAELRQLA